MIGLTFFQLLIICLFSALIGIITFFICFLWFIYPYADFNYEEEDTNNAE